jgi:PAP2 superfamily C-terminal
LVAGLGLSLVAIELQGASMKRNLWSMAMRAVLTLAAARFIRTISFLITVLPSQSPRCYFGHFPYPPPTEWSEWILEGMKPQVNGGCNDLIISGHATVTSTLACLVVSIVNKPLFSVALWMFVAMDYMVEVYEGFHYSVDMWLGAIMVNFIWRTLSPIEDSHAAENATTKRFLPLQDATVSDVMRYAFPALVTYVQVVQIIPQHMGNYTIVVYLAGVIFQLIRDGFQQYTQHCLFCLLYMALGVYL